MKRYFPLNGSGREDLKDQYSKVVEKAGELCEALNASYPHPRDWDSKGTHENVTSLSDCEVLQKEWAEAHVAISKISARAQRLYTTILYEEKTQTNNG